MTARLNFTDTYTRLHVALVHTSKAHSLETTDVRVLLALEELGQVDSLVLGGALGLDGWRQSQVRRAWSRLEARGMVTLTGQGGKPRGPGVRTVLRITDEGRAIVRACREEAGAE